jgi:hypothetical protein
MSNANAHALGTGSTKDPMQHLDGYGKQYETGGKRDGPWRTLLPGQQPVTNLRF